MPRQVFRDFRGYTATAPLKLTYHRHRGMVFSLFPWLHSHGPIEARALHHYASVAPLISVATQPRPH